MLVSESACVAVVAKAAMEVDNGSMRAGRQLEL